MEFIGRKKIEQHELRAEKPDCDDPEKPSVVTQGCSNSVLTRADLRYAFLDGSSGGLR
jgi:hypothetical protein